MAAEFPPDVRLCIDERVREFKMALEATVAEWLRSKPHDPENSTICASIKMYGDD